MRLVEPMRGFHLVGGHTVFHVTLLIGSYVVLNFVDPELYDKVNNQKMLAQVSSTIGYLRLAHLIEAVSCFVRLLEH